MPISGKILFMGTWISHLRVAEKLLNKRTNLEPIPFTFGSLAPDSGIPNEASSKFDPPKEVTHFLYRGEGEAHIRDWQFLERHLKGVNADTDPERYSFLLAYYAHLICDILWVKNINVTIHRDFKADFAEKGNQFWWKTKEDWYGLDILYVQDHPQSLFWRVFMVEPTPLSYVDFLPQAAINQQMERIRQFYSRPEPEWLVDRPYPYLNEPSMSRFVDNAVTAIEHILDNLESLPEGSSAVSILPQELIEPFPSPLGDPTYTQVQVKDLRGQLTWEGDLESLRERRS
jgi:hypothetical protein